MFRGTNPKFKFTLQFSASEISDGFVTFSQLNKTVAEKSISECSCEEKEIICALTQEETLKFNHMVPVEIQLRVRTASGDALASQIWSVKAERILKEGVI